MHVTILGRRYRFRFTRALERGTAGECDEPSRRGKEIRIRDGLSPEATLDTVVHEVLHAADWHKDEAWVEQVASDLTRILWRLGYRRASGASLDDDPA